VVVPLFSTAPTHMARERQRVNVTAFGRARERRTLTRSGPLSVLRPPFRHSRCLIDEESESCALCTLPRPSCTTHRPVSFSLWPSLSSEFFGNFPLTLRPVQLGTLIQSLIESHTRTFMYFNGKNQKTKKACDSRL